MKRLIGLIAVLALTWPAMADAPTSELEERAAAGNARYAEAWVAGDIDGLMDMFADGAVYWPAGGGQYDGKPAIRDALEAGPVPTSATIETTHVERLNGLILDIGTFVVTIPDNAGQEVRGEFIAVMTETDDGLLIERLIGFPVRGELPEE
jgi:ketosteroid isomerase-like protein